MQYLIVGQHPPDLCPGANETVRKLSSEGAAEIPALAQKLGVKILAPYVPMINHQVYAAVEADDANAVREFAYVLMRIPNQATPYEPRIPSTDQAKMRSTRSNS